MKSIWIIFILPIGLLFGEMPWGKDAGLAYWQPNQECSCSPSCCDPLAELGIRLIRFHKECISKADGPRSNFIPNSSQYTLDAMRKYGFFHGVIRGCDRLMRENSEEWIYPITKDAYGHCIKSDPLK